MMIDKLNNRTFFSPGSACLDALISCIRSAHTCLDICVFTIADDRLTKEIIYRHKNGIKIRLLTDNDKCYDLGSDIDALVKARVPVKVDNTRFHMHHKFMLVDNRHVISGSFNWTRSASENNHENLLITDNKEIVKGYSDEFDKLWQELKVY